MTAPARSQSPMNSASARRQSASGARAPEAANAADAESRVRSEKSRTETTTAPAVDANLQLDGVGTWANAAGASAAIAGENCGVSRPIRRPHGLECLA